MPKFGGDDYKFPDELDEQTKQAATEEKFEVEIEDDTPLEDRGRKPMKEPVEDPTEEELASYDEKVQARIKKFTRGYHDERRAKEEAQREREAAENFAKQVLEDNKRLQQQLATGSKAFIEQSQTSADLELATAKKKYKEAYENGDVDAIADAQAEIAKATLKLDKARELKPIEVEEREFSQPQQPQQPPLSRRTQKWVDSNSDWWGVDEEMTAAAMGLDKKLAREYGADYVGSEEYFRTIDKTMRKRFPEYFEDVQSNEDDDDEPPKRVEPAQEETPRRAKSSSPVAPAARSTPPSRVKLKQSQVALARKLGITPEQYAKQVALLGRNE